GRTAADIVAQHPRSYVGVDDTAAATETVRGVVAPVDGIVVVADAAATGLPDASADVVVGEAMLTMQGDKAKRAIVAEAFRVLRPGGR
ncbi:SAM-dependent methyltransferase, partial [Mycobacterium sp. ITM-2017-0098]